ncbi:MAG: S46 family peptidase [Bacteroidales bacterium]|nr:S46 family peptidase [Bacteroidales bacterium]
MLKKTFIFLICSIFFISSSLRADEGLWPFFSLKTKYEKLKEMGLEISEDSLFNNSGNGLFNSVVKFGEDCSGFLISKNGLVITSYHCGHKFIQENSSLSNNLIYNGFSANSINEDLPCKNISVKMLVEIEDITNSIKAGLSEDISAEEKEKSISLIYEKLIEQKQADQFVSYVLSEENENYYIYKYIEYKDVRLVMAPPFSIGKFGGDEDNWLWPRHSGNFAIFRIYANSDNKPSDYSENNLPLKTNNYLKISLAKKKENDFALIVGFPSYSNRYGNSRELNREEKKILPFRIDLYKGASEILQQKIRQTKNLDLLYGEALQQQMNHLKYYRTLVNYLYQNKIAEKRNEEEDRLFVAISKMESFKNKYIDATGIFLKEIPKISEIGLLKILIDQAKTSCHSFKLAYYFINIYHFFEQNMSKAEISNKIKLIPELHNTNDEATEKELFIFLLNFTSSRINEEFHPLELTKIQKTYKGNLTKYCKKAYAGSIFTNKDLMLKFIENPDIEVLERDPIFKLAFSFYGSINKFEKLLSTEISQLNFAKQVFLKAKYLTQSKTDFYPEANGNARFSYGKIRSFFPGNAIKYNWQTIVYGMLEKNDPYSENYFIPEKFINETKQEINDNYLNVNGKLPICFISDCDIMRGNSGSPVLNKKAEAIGMVFDINKEAVGMSYNYNINKHRVIAVDMKFVLFVADYFFNNKSIIEELSISTE